MHERSFPQCGVLEQSESISLRITNVLRYRSMQVLVPRRVLIDKAIRHASITLILNLQRLREHLVNNVVVLIVVNTKCLARGIKREQSILQEEIPLHELHGVVGLITARFIVLQDAQYATCINA